MKLNQKGAVDMMFVIALVVVLAGAGFAIWRVVEADSTVQDTATNTESGSTVPAATASDNNTNSEEVAQGYQLYEDKDYDYSFQYPEEWITLSTSNDGSVTFLSEERIEDETAINAPLSKNVYLFITAGADSRVGAGIRYAAGSEQGELIEPLPEVFRSIKLGDGTTAYVYKQLTSSVEGTTPAEIYFLADKDMNNLLLKNGEYLRFRAEFNGMQGDYAVVTPLKQSGTFNPDESQEVSDFVFAATTLVIN